MKITIKLDKRKTGETSKGFPIVVYISQNYKSKPFRTGFYAKNKEWNDRISSPKSSHPDYYFVLEALELIRGSVRDVLKKSIVSPISIQEAAKLVFTKNFNTFIDAAYDFLPDPENYNDTRVSAVRSFQKHSPNIAIEEINKAVVEDYKNECLKKQKPAGIDSYVRSLRAIFNQVSTLPNPFSGMGVAIPKKVNTVASLGDLWVLEDIVLKYRGEFGSAGRYRDYFMLMFYLGGIDPEVLARLRYDEHMIDGRIVFNRKKGGSNVACSNIVPTAALEILEKYDCKPYLVPIFKAKNYIAFEKNFNSRFQKVCGNIELSKKLKPKTPRYTFIDRAQQLLIDERVTAQIVGHKRKTTTSLYSNDFPQKIQDAAHLKIISF